MKALRPKHAAEASMSRSQLYRHVRSGRLQQIGPGVYLPAHASDADWDQLEASAKRPDATICLISALAHHDLTDVIPDSLDIAIPRGTRSPVTTGAISWHQFDAETFGLGRSDVAIVGSEQTVGLYSAERTIVDCFRLRGSIGYEVPRDALKEWLRRGGKTAAILDIAVQLPRAKAPVLQALEMLS